MEANHPRQLRPAEHEHQNVDDDYKAASKDAHESVDYKQYMPKLKSERKALHRLGKAIAVLLVVAILGLAAYYIGSKYNAPTTKTSKKTSTTAKTAVKAPTQTYTSNYQNLTFVYPNDWKVSETTDTITATSPVMQLTSYARQTVTGQVVFRVRAHGAALNEFNAGSAMAAIDSQIIAYASPAAGQRGSTYISFLNYADSKGGGIDGIYITGNAGYKTGQYVPKTDVQAIDPVISITFDKCSNKTCDGSVSPLTIAANSWSSKQFSNPLLAILESLTIS